MKKIWVLALSAALLLTALAGCTPREESLLMGTWEGQVDLAEAYEALLAVADPAITGHIDIGDFSVDMTLTFREDGTYTWEADQQDMESGVANLMEAVEQGMITYLQIETGKNIDNLLAVTGQTMDELMEQHFDPDMLGVVRGNLESEGTFRISGGKLTLTDQDGQKVFEGKCDVSEDVLKLKTGVTSDLISSLLPLEWEKD